MQDAEERKKQNAAAYEIQDAEEREKQNAAAYEIQDAEEREMQSVAAQYGKDKTGWTVPGDTALPEGVFAVCKWR